MTSDTPTGTQDAAQAGGNRQRTTGQAQTALGADAQKRENASDITTMQAIANRDVALTDRPGIADTYAGEQNPNYGSPEGAQGNSSSQAGSGNQARQASGGGNASGGGGSNAGGGGGNAAAGGATAMATGLAGAGVGAAVGSVFGPLGLVTGAVAGAAIGAAAPVGTGNFDPNNTALTGSALFKAPGGDGGNQQGGKSG